MRTIKTLFLLAAVLIAFQTSTYAVGGFGYNNYRIASSADGNNQPDLEYTGTYNTADPDDWGATPMSLAILAKARLQDKLVHYSYNNFIPSPPHTTETNFMKRNCDDAIERFQFNEEVFFDVGTHQEEAVLHLKDELIKSTASDPLYFILAGPSEFLYRAVDSVIQAGGIESLSHVYVISHSGYNEDHLRRDTHHTFSDVMTLSGDRIKYKKIADQNTCEIGYKGLCSNTNAYPWRNFKDHRDPNLVWLYERMQDHKHGKYDVSDAGMFYYLLKNNESASPSALDNFFDFGILLPGEEITSNIDITKASITIYPQRGYQLEYSTTPKVPWDNFMTWKTSNAEVAYVSPTGRIVGVSPGIATITVTAGIENKKDEITVKVEPASNCQECSETCELSEVDGLFVFEAERFNLKGQWEVVSGDNYASGGKYITYNGPNSYGSQNLANEISYTFHINTPGMYTVKWFMRQPYEAEGDLSNDIWIYIDNNLGYANGSTVLTGYQKFVGRSKTVFTMNGQLDIDHSSSTLKANFASAGDYTIKACGRSEHIQIDKFVLYHNSVSNPVSQASNITETTTCMGDVLGGDPASIKSNRIENTIKIYPNPMEDAFNIESQEQGILEITAMDGRLISSSYILTGVNTIQLNDVQAGNYILSLRTPKGLKNELITVKGSR